MKKLCMTLLTVLTCGSAFALPVGNPSDASLLCDGLVWEGHCGDFCDPCLNWSDAFSMRFGFYGDYVFNRHMEIDEHDRDHRDIEHTQLFTNAGLLTANFWDRLDIFATLGATNIFIDTNKIAFNGIGTGRVEVETDTSFSWSVGVRGTLLECGCTTLGAEAQYFRTCPDISRVTVEAADSVYPDASFTGRYHEWQVGVGVSHRINVFVPYIAIKWSGAKMDFDDAALTVGADDLTLFDTRSKKVVGYAVGVSLVDCEKASLTVEGRFADEKAVHVNAQIRF